VRIKQKCCIQVWERLAAKAREAPRRAAAYRQFICKGLWSYVSLTRVSPKRTLNPAWSSSRSAQCGCWSQMIPAIRRERGVAAQTRRTWRGNRQQHASARQVFFEITVAYALLESGQPKSSQTT